MHCGAQKPSEAGALCLVSIRRPCRPHVLIPPARGTGCCGGAPWWPWQALRRGALGGPCSAARQRLSLPWRLLLRPPLPRWPWPLRPQSPWFLHPCLCPIPAHFSRPPRSRWSHVPWHPSAWPSPCVKSLPLRLRLPKRVFAKLPCRRLLLPPARSPSHRRLHLLQRLQQSYLGPRRPMARCLRRATYRLL